MFFGVEALPGRPVKRQILVSWPMSHALSVLLRFYCRLKYQPALVALLQQADCQPVHDLGRLNHQPAREMLWRGAFAFAQGGVPSPALWDCELPVSCIA